MLSSLAGDANGVKFHVVAPSLPNYAWSAGKQLIRVLFIATLLSPD